MFQKIRTRLLFNNLLVFALVLSGAAIAVRLVFVQNLKQQISEKLIAGGQGVVAEAELDNSGRLEVEDEFLAQTLLNDHQSFEWFDLQGKSVERMGESFPETPLDRQATANFVEVGKHRIHYVTLPIIGEETGERIGYVRVGELMDEFDETVLQLDVGLGVGAIAATILSSAGIFWLNRQAMEPIEESFRRLKQFTADASHELRSPLMAISSNAEVSLKYPEGMREDDHDAMIAMLSASEQMRSLTEDLLLLARTDKVSPMQLAPLNLASLLKDLVQLYHTQAAEKNIALTSEVDPELWVQGDSSTLIRAFTNLVQNAIRYTPSGGAISIKAKQLSNQIQVMVKDTGMGIAQENLENIFERFWRADQARSHNDGGSGLGLSITQAIVQSHRGHIEVTSAPGRGSCFTIDLPITPQG